MGLPILPLFIDDFEADTAHLSFLEDGAFNRLIRLCWRSPGCKVPADEEWLFRQMRARTDDEKQAVRAVVKEFFKRSRGKIYSKRLLKEFDRALSSHNSKSKAGKMGAAVKALKRHQTGPSNDEAKPKHPYPYPYPDKKERAPSQKVTEADRITRLKSTADWVKTGRCPASAVSPQDAREMLANGWVTETELKRIGVYP